MPLVRSYLTKGSNREREKCPEFWEVQGFGKIYKEEKGKVGPF